jgi:hypothetical protein
MKWVRFVSSFTTLVAVLIAGPSNTRLVASPPNTLPDAQKQWAAEPLGLPLKFANAKIYNSGTFENDFVAVGDLNGDGHPDVVVVAANASPSILGVLLGKGDGTFNAPVTYVAGGNSSSAVVIGDVNGDGFLDLVVANESASNSSGEGDVSVLLGNGNGTFQPAVNYDSGGSDATALAIADVNGDKHPDIVVVNRCDSECTGNGTVGVLLNDGKGSFLAPILYSSGALLPDSVAVGDFTGDGKPDIVVAHKCAADGECNTSNGSLGVLLNNGDGTFKAPVVYGSGGYLYALAVAVADMNGDGKLDLIVGNWCESIAVCGGFTPTGGVSVLLGNGNGTFQLPVAYAAGTGNAASIAVGDANGDGHPDVLVNGAEDEDVYILLGNGDGTLQAPVGFASDVQTTVAVALEDLNGDGRPDVVVGIGTHRSACY